MVSPLAGEEARGMLVTAVDVVDSVNDAGALTAILERAEAETGVRTPLTLAAAGYHAGEHLAASEQRVVMPDRDHRVANPYHRPASSTTRPATATAVLTANGSTRSPPRRPAGAVPPYRLCFRRLPR